MLNQINIWWNENIADIYSYLKNMCNAMLDIWKINTTKLDHSL